MIVINPEFFYKMQEEIEERLGLKFPLPKDGEFTTYQGVPIKKDPKVAGALIISEPELPY